MGITTISFIYKKAVSESHSSDTAFCCLSEIWVKYSPPIEAGASFNPPNLTEDFILRASVSEAMGFL